MTRAALLLVAAVACGRSAQPVPATTATTATAHVASAGDRILGLLPDGAQVIVELDLARLRANPVVGDVVRRALAPEVGLHLPSSVPSSPLATTDRIVLAAYGVGSAQAATLVLLATAAEVPGARRITPDIVGLGPEDWLDQLEVRAQLATVAPSADLLALRDHAMPAAAPGAALRITARLPFDARISLARQTGLESAPAQISIWGDVVDDLAFVIDADAADPGDRKAKSGTKELQILFHAALASLAEEPMIRALGIPQSLANARYSVHGTWVRAIIAIGPAHLLRVVQRAKTLLDQEIAPT